MVEIFFHLLFLLVISSSSYFVVVSTSPVDSVLFLIIVFLNSAGYLLLVEAEFLAIIFLVIYVGAIAVLFLFIVMMLNIKVQKGEGQAYMPLSILLGIIFFTEISIAIESSFSSSSIRNSSPYWYLMIDNVNNVDVLGQCLYTDFVSCFLLSGVLLLIAMIGAIVLTVKFISYRKNEILPKQYSRTREILTV